MKMPIPEKLVKAACRRADERAWARLDASATEPKAYRKLRNAAMFGLFIESIPYLESDRKRRTRH